MAAKLRKQVLKVGKYHSPDGEVDVTPDRLKHWASEFARLSANEYDVPVAWDHGNTAATLAPINRKHMPSAKDTVGKLSTFVVAPDGQSAEIVLDISDPRGAEQSEANRVQVSPVILPAWKDGKGNSYSDVLTHFDLVNHAVDHSQTPFTRLSGDAKALGAIRFSLDEVSDVDEEKPAGEIPEKPKSETEPAPPVAEDQPEEVDPDAIVMARIIGLMRGKGMPIEDANDIPSFLMALEKVLAMPEQEEATPSSPSASKVEQPNAMMMSLQKYADSLYQEKIERRLKDLAASGRCTPAELTAKTPALKAIRMSLDDKGTHKTGDLELWIAHREELPENSVCKPATGEPVTRMSADGVAELPSGSLANEAPTTTKDPVKAATENLKSAGFKV